MEIKNFFATNAKGDIMPDALCYVYNSGTTVLATGLQDISGNPLANPFTSQGNGLIQFSAPDKVYDLRVVKGARDYTLRGIQCVDLIAFLNANLAFDNYSGIRAYSGVATRIKITDPQLKGTFVKSPDVVAPVDNGGTRLVDADGVAWDRIYDGVIYARWWGVDEKGVIDSTLKLQDCLTAAGDIAAAEDCEVVVNIHGKLRLSRQFYHTLTDWGQCVLVRDNVRVVGIGCKIVTAIPFSTRSVIFLARGDNISFRTINFYDELTASACFGIGVGSGSTYDSLIGVNRTYESLLVKGCKSKNLWMTASVQYGTLDDGTVFHDGVKFKDCESIARPNNTTSGNFNARSDPPRKVKNVEMESCVAKNGATATSFNFVGVDGGSATNCRSELNLYGACEVENGCRDIVISNLRSRDDAKGVWIDDSVRVKVFGLNMVNTVTSLVTPLLGTLPLNRNAIFITKQGYATDPNAETGQIQLYGITGENISFNITSFGTPVGTPVFSDILVDGFDIENDGVSLGGRAIFFSAVKDITFRNGKITGAATEQITGNSVGGHCVLENIYGYLKGAETPAGVSISGTSKSTTINVHLQSFLAFPSGDRYEVDTSDTSGRRPTVNPGGQRQYWAISGTPEGVLTSGPGSTVARSDTGQWYRKDGATSNGWRELAVVP